MNAVTCVQWVQRGAAKSKPDQVKLTEEELCDLVKGMKKTALDEESTDEEDDGGEISTSRKRKVPHKTSENPKSNAATNAQSESEESNEGSDEEINPLSMAGISYYASQKDDPHLSKDPDSDEDNEILDSDNLIVVGKVNKEFCNLEVYVYNEEEGNCWCHHDYILPTIPLCLEWLDFDPGSSESGNFMAIGNVGPDIELWDLDVLDTLEPTFVLAGEEKKVSKKKKKKTASKGHTDAILDLSWNRNHKQALASASADFTLGLWDLDEGKMVTRFPHKEKVQSIEWHPSDPHTILSGSADKMVRLFDCRTLDPDVKKWHLTGEVENVIWNKSNTDYFMASTDEGQLYCCDRRQNTPVFQLKAHNESVTGISLSNSVNGCLVTSSSDKTIKVWDVKNDQPKHICTKELKIGQLFCVSGCPDSSLIYAVGGERELRVVNLKKHSVVAEYFGINEKLTDGNVDIQIGDGEEDEEEEDDESAKVTEKKKRKKKKSKKPVDTELQESKIEATTACCPDESQGEKKKKKKKKKKKVVEDD